MACIISSGALFADRSREYARSAAYLAFTHGKLEGLGGSENCLVRSGKNPVGPVSRNRDGRMRSLIAV